jgi:hypothetical protein
MVRRPWQDLDALGRFCHWWQDLDERRINAMGILILTLVIASLVLGLERNARRARRRLPAVPAWPQPHERRDRDAERLLDELRSHA